MDLKLKGTTAIVTGASQGIGREIARALHREGASIVAVSQNAERLRHGMTYVAESTTGKSAPIHAIVADLALQAEVDRVVSEAMDTYGHVDFLINNAARTRTSNFFDMTDKEIGEAWQVKALGYMRMVRAVVPSMRSQGAGHILNIVGTTARTPAPDFIVGSMVNAALINFTRGVARELARDQIYVNAISPGWTLTERQLRSFELEAAARKETLDQVLSRAARAMPLRRLVTMDEIATLAVLLLSGKFPALTGEEIILDGGATPSI